MARSRKTAPPEGSKKKRGGSRFGWFLTLLVVLALIAIGSGLIHVDWSDGKPTITADREKLGQLRDYLARVATKWTGGNSANGELAKTDSADGDSTADDSASGDSARDDSTAGDSAAASEYPSETSGNPAEAPGNPAQTSRTRPDSSGNPARTSPYGPAPSAPLVPIPDDSPETSAPPAPPLLPVPPGRQAPQAPATAARQGDTIKVATFNIQVFGTSKLKKTEAMKVLTNIVRRFDVVAIQEVRSTDDDVIPTFINMINADGARYDFVIGPRLGRTNSKEQYTIVFDTTRIEVSRRSVYTTPDPEDLLHREPMAARFRVRGVPPEQAFTFTLVDIHTDPDETKTELDALADTFVGVEQNGSGEDDVILLGDLNVDEYHLGRLGQLPEITHAITGVTTNTRRNKMYDNIVFNRLATSEYTGQWGVLDLMDEFGLSEQQALVVSDHCPAWAEFSSYEASNSGPVAQRPRQPR